MPSPELRAGWLCDFISGLLVNVVILPFLELRMEVAQLASRAIPPWPSNKDIRIQTQICLTPEPMSLTTVLAGLHSEEGRIQRFQCTSV